MSRLTRYGVVFGTGPSSGVAAEAFGRPGPSGRCGSRISGRPPAGGGRGAPARGRGRGTRASGRRSSPGARASSPRRSFRRAGASTTAKPSARTSTSETRARSSGSSARRRARSRAPRTTPSSGDGAPDGSRTTKRGRAERRRRRRRARGRPGRRSRAPRRAARGPPARAARPGRRSCRGRRGAPATRATHGRAERSAIAASRSTERSGRPIQGSESASTSLRCGSGTPVRTTRLTRKRGCLWTVGPGRRGAPAEASDDERGAEDGPARRLAPARGARRPDRAGTVEGARSRRLPLREELLAEAVDVSRAHRHEEVARPEVLPEARDDVGADVEVDDVPVAARRAPRRRRGAT